MKFNLNVPRMGYFILVRHNGDIFGRGIEKSQLKAGFSAEAAKFSHVEVSGGGQWSVCVAPPRTQIVDITKRYKGRYLKIVRYTGPEYEDKKRYKVAFWAATHCNLPYDWRGIFAFIWKKIKQHASFWFCSENAAWALQKEYPCALDKVPEKCVPADFLNPKWFKVTWEGEIPDETEKTESNKAADKEVKPGN